MKMTFFFMLTFFNVGFAANLYSQQISISERNVSLEDVFSKIEKQSGYQFFYNDRLLQMAHDLTINVTNVSVKEALDACFKNQPLSYSIVNKTVVVEKKKSESNNKTFVIRGVVHDQDGNPMPGVTVVVETTSRGTFTDSNGNFALQVRSDDKALIFSFVGTHKERIGISKGVKHIYMVMHRQDSKLDEIQVTAYGETTRRFDVGNVSSISGEELRSQPVANISLALQGRVPGLEVTPLGGGIPGAAVNLQVRGQNTLASTPSSGQVYDQPLIIVDGIPTAMQNNSSVQFLNSFIAGSGLSPLNSLNPNDIASISVLKDADATSIYGSQGANGVIVITTKRGKSGKTAFNFSVNMGPNSPTDNLKMLNTQQYVALRKRAVELDGIDLNSLSSGYRSSFYDLLTYDTTKYTDWVKKFFNKNPINLDVHASISGGAGENSYIFSGGFTRSAYNLPGDFADSRYTFHHGSHYATYNRKFTMDFGVDLSYDKNNSSVSSQIGEAMTLAPNTPDMLTPDGELVWDYNGMTINNLIAQTKQPYSMKMFSLQSNIKLNYELYPGLKIGVLAGYSRGSTREYSAVPAGTQDPNEYISRTATFGLGISQSIDIEPQLNYRKMIGNGVFTALVGGTYKRNTSYSNRQVGSGYPDDAFLKTIEAATDVMFYDNSSIYKYVGAFARLSYIYNNRYIVNLTGRRDGSSNFGPNNRFGNFGSGGLGWIFSEEDAFKKALPFISFGKIAGNYGTNGTDGVAAYNYQAFWKIYNSNPSTFQGAIPLIPNNLYNPDYSWASKRSLSISMDLGFIENRILLHGNWYRNRTVNQLSSYPLPSQTGFTSVVQNIDAKVQNKGIELSLTTKNIQGKNFNWTTTFNISRNRNKLLSFPNLESSSYAGTYEIGKSVSTQYAFKYAGVDPETGIFQYYKADGTKTSSGLSYTRVANGGDMVPVSSGTPDYYGGLGNAFTYKGLSLNVFFQFKKAYSKNYLYSMYNGMSGPGGAGNIPEYMLNKIWSGPGDDHAVMQRPTTGSYVPGMNAMATEAQTAANYFPNSTGAYSNIYYIRLKTLSLAYQLPEKWTHNVHMSDCRVYLNAQNVFTVTNYKFGDPELPGQLYGIPTQRVVSLGLSLNF